MIWVLVLDDGATRLAFVVVDNCLIDRALLDGAKALIFRHTGISSNHASISTTHTHSAGSVTGVHLSEPVQAYRSWLPRRIADGVRVAVNNLAPAKVAWGNGTSGDVNNIDFRKQRPAQKPYEQIQIVAEEVAREVHRVVNTLSHRDDVKLAAASAELGLAYRKPSAADFRVGFAQADSTPPVGRRRAGNYTELISTGVSDPLMTKAMVVQDGATTFAFVGNDLCSLSRDLTDLARQRASQLTGIPLANIVIAAAWSNRQSASLEIVIQRLEGFAQGGSTRAPARGSSRPP